MKLNRILGAALVSALMVTTAAAAAPDYSFQIGKLGRTPSTVPYAGMNYEGGEQGDTSAYTFRIGKAGRGDGSAENAPADYSFRAGRIGKPWNTGD